MCDGAPKRGRPHRAEGRGGRAGDGLVRGVRLDDRRGARADDARAAGRVRVHRRQHRRGVRVPGRRARHRPADQQQLLGAHQLRPGAGAAVPAHGRAVLPHRARDAGVRCDRQADGPGARPPVVRDRGRRHRVRRALRLEHGEHRAARLAHGPGDGAPRLQPCDVDRPDPGRGRPCHADPALGARRAARHARPDRRRPAADRRRGPRPDPRRPLCAPDPGAGEGRPAPRARLRRRAGAACSASSGCWSPTSCPWASSCSWWSV